MIPLTKRQEDVLNCIRSHVANFGFPPTRVEIARALGIGAEQSIEVHIKALIRKGKIEVSHKRSRGIKLLNPDHIPVIDASREINQSETIPGAIGNAEAIPGRFAERFTSKPDFFVELQDDTMGELGARTGDMVAVRASTSAQNGETVIARIGTKLAWRRLEETDEGSVQLIAMPAEGEHRPAPTVMTRETLRIEGVVIGVLIARRLPS